jgi:mycothiol synthase
MPRTPHADAVFATRSQPDGGVLVQLPQVYSDASLQLLDAVARWQTSQVPYGQVLIAEPCESYRQLLEFAGFHLLTRLEFWRAEVPLQAPTALDSRLRMIPWEQLPTWQVREVLHRTYEGSLDAPEMNRFRRDDLPLDPTEFSVVAFEGPKPVGVLMLSSTEQPAELELSYLGIVPENRGRGLGKLLLERTFQVAVTAGCHSLILSVDERNIPAKTLYLAKQFRLYELRQVWLWTNTKPS